MYKSSGSALTSTEVTGKLRIHAPMILFYHSTKNKNHYRICF